MYRALRTALEPVIQPGADLSTLERHATNVTPEELQTAFRHYEDLRFGRLCSFLRTREPDDEVGHSILIYRLTDADVAGALEGKPPELLPAQSSKNAQNPNGSQSLRFGGMLVV